MNENVKAAMYAAALEKYGLAAQVTMVFEETGELQNALAKYIRGRASEQDVISELADVSIMVEQMARLFGQEEYEAEKERKLNRLAERLAAKNDSQIPEKCVHYNKETYMCAKCQIPCWLDVMGYKCDEYNTNSNAD